MSAVRTSLSPSATRAIWSRLRRANAAFDRHYPGEPGARQPIHTVYEGADQFAADSAARLGERALQALAAYAPDAATLGELLGLRDQASSVYARVVAKLASEPVEDYRIDFEDGYGQRAEAEEDGEALRTASEVAKGMGARSLPPFLGIRLKPLSGGLGARAIRTLDIFVTALAGRTRGRLPAGFVVTLTKVTIPEQVAAAAQLCSLLERRTRLPAGSLKLELMVETTPAILNRRGEAGLRELVAAGGGRCRGAHFGVYDYTASCGIPPAAQTLDHPACDFARHVMEVGLAGTGLWISDGATNLLPVAPHASPTGRLAAEQLRENRAAVHRAWRIHYDHVRHSLAHAYYQGWDLHPAQLATRYAAVYAFFLGGLDATVLRLRAFTERASQAALAEGVLDDAATGQGLLNFLLRGLSCGALGAEEVARTGLRPEEIRGGSFLRILKNRRARGSQVQ